MPDALQLNRQVKGGLTLALDMTSLRLDTERRVAEITAAKDRAEYANRTKTAFLAMVSHELRTPLTAIVGFSELACTFCDENPSAPPKLAAYAVHIRDAATHLSGLINRVLDLSKIEAGRMEVSPEMIDASDSIRSALWMMSERAAASGVALDMSDDPRMEPMWVDEQMLTEMLLNLLSNAIKFTPPGGRVTVSAAVADDEGVTLTVADTGCGIPTDKIAFVFSPYEQIDKHYRRALPGTGLGLSLVRAMMELHGGRISIASPPDRGTAITLHFPPPPSSELKR